VYFRNLLAGIWDSFLRFIETGFRNWLAACREPALTQKVSLRLKPYWSFTINTHHFCSPYVLLVSSCATWQSGIIFFFLTPTVNDLLYRTEKLAVGARARSRALRLRPCTLPSNHPCLSFSSQAWRIFVPIRFCMFSSVSRLGHDSRILYPSGRRAGGRHGRGHGARGCSGTGEPPHRRRCFPHRVVAQKTNFPAFFFCVQWGVTVTVTVSRGL